MSKWEGHGLIGRQDRRAGGLVRGHGAVGSLEYSANDRWLDWLKRGLSGLISGGGSGGDSDADSSEANTFDASGLRCVAGPDEGEKQRNEVKDVAGNDAPQGQPLPIRKNGQTLKLSLQSHARLWTLIASAERHGLDPQKYVMSVLAKIGQTPISELEQFLPDTWKADDAAEANRPINPAAQPTPP